MALSLSFDASVHGDVVDSYSYSWSSNVYETYQDGTEVTRYSDGGMRISNPDGSSIKVNEDGSGYAYSNDWSEYLSVRSDGSTYHSYPDGSSMSSRADGSGHIKDDEGSYVFYQKGGEPYSWSNTPADLNQNCEALSDTGVVPAEPEVEITYPYEETLDDGALKTTEEDGSFSIKHVDGSIETEDTDGNVTVTQADGSYITEYADGSSKTAQADGSYQLDYGNGQVDTVNADGTGTTDYTLSVFGTNESVTVQVGLGESFGVNSGVPEAYSQGNNGGSFEGTSFVTYDGQQYQIDNEWLDTSWKDDFSDGENIKSLRTDYKGDQVVKYNDESDYDTITILPNGAEFIDYADGVKLDESIGTDKGVPEKYDVDGDMVSITYADGSGYKTEAENIDLNWLSDYPQGMTSFRPSWNEGETYISFSEESDIQSMVVKENGAQYVDYKEGVILDKPLTSDETPVTFYRDGDNITVEYADGSGYTTEAVNADLSFLDGFPEPDLVTSFHGSEDGTSVWYDQSAEVQYLNTYTDEAGNTDHITIQYKDGSTEEEFADGSYAFVSTDGTRYKMDADGNSTVSKDGQSHTIEADGGWNIFDGSSTSYYKVVDETGHGLSKGDVIASGTGDDFQGYDHQSDSMINVKHSDGTYLFTEENGSTAWNYGEGSQRTINEDGLTSTGYTGSKIIVDDPNAGLNFSQSHIWLADGANYDVESGYFSIPESAIFKSLGETSGTDDLGSTMAGLLLGEYYPNPADAAMGQYESGHGDIVTNENGSQTLSREDGYQFTWFEDGHMEGICPENAGNPAGSQEYYPNAVGQEASYIFNYPDTKDFSEGANFTKYADGSASYSDGEHQVDWPQYPPVVGTEISFQMPDGSYGKEIVTKLTDVDFADISTSITVTQLPGGEEPIISTSTTGEMTGNDYSNFKEYNQYTLNDDGSIDTAGGLSVSPLAIPEGLPDPLTMPEIEHPGFSWEADIQAPGFLPNNSYFDNESMQQAVNNDLSSRVESAVEEVPDIPQSDASEGLNEATVIDEPELTFTRYQEGDADITISNTGHYSRSIPHPDPDRDGDLLCDLHYVTEPNEHEGTFQRYTEDGSYIEYSSMASSESLSPTYSVTTADGHKVSHDPSDGEVRTSDGHGNSTLYSPTTHTTFFNLPDGSSYRVNPDGEITSAFDSNGVETSAYVDESGDIQCIQTELSSDESGVITINVNTDGKEIITHIDDFAVPGMADIESVQQQVMDAAPDEIVEYVVKYGPQEMTDGLADRLAEIEQAEAEAAEAEATEVVDDSSSSSADPWGVASVTEDDAGNKTTTYNDGSSQFEGADGSYTWKGTDGSVSSYSADGTSYWDDGLGNTSSWNADGTGSWTEADGTTGVWHGDGSSTATFADGSVETYNWLGNVTSITGADGNPVEIINPEPGEYPQDDGSVEIWFDDGSHSVSWTDGSVVTYGIDDSYTWESDSGYTGTSYADGSSEWSDTDGSFGSWNSDGSWSTTYADGTTESGEPFDMDNMGMPADDVTMDSDSVWSSETEVLDDFGIEPLSSSTDDVPPVDAFSTQPVNEVSSGGYDSGLDQQSQALSEGSATSGSAVATNDMPDILHEENSETLTEESSVL